MENTMRCFIGIPVTGPLAHRLSALPMPAGARPVPPENLHLTLAFLGDRDAAWLSRLTPRLAHLAGRHPAFPVTLASAGPFPEPSSSGGVRAARALPAGALQTLHRDLWSELAALGVNAEARRFLPHVTLCRGAGGRGGEGIGKEVPGPWVLPVGELMLYHSLGAGASYRVMGRWALDGR